MTRDLAAITIGAPTPLGGPVTLAAHNSAWAAMFDGEAIKIRAALGERALAVQHVGSTSVPELSAKPIIDILVLVADSAREEDYVPPLEAVGYLLRIREPGWFEHRLFKGLQPDVNMHVFSQDCPEPARMLAFRDHLRISEEDRILYETAKRTLARQDWAFTQDYADSKTAVVQAILSRALGTK